MNLQQEFGPHLPFLRRYARALTGSQTSGDAYILASLKALARDPSPIDRALPARIALFKFFHTIASQAGAPQETQAKDDLAPSDERLQALAPIQRQAFLLSALEGFADEDAASILDISVASFSDLIDQANSEIDRDLQTKILIVEDEPIIAADLESLVSDLGHTVTGNATTREEAVTMARETAPGLILCDIQLADNSSGIDAAHDILNEHDVPIIFITAFPERLLTGEKPEPTYLIQKPFKERSVKAAISQALFFHT